MKSQLIQRALLMAALAIAAISCTQDQTDIDATVDARIQTAIAEIPTSTPQPSATPQPTATAQPTSTPAATPVPTGTPQPTATPFPTATPAPTATPQPTATPIDTTNLSGATLPSDIYADLRRSVVRISAGETYGSGWAIEEGWIITNAHVVEGNSTVTVEVPLANGGVTSRTGTVRGVDTKRDLAAVEVNHGAPVLPRRVVTALNAGEPVVQMGYSVAAVGGYPVIHYGIITTVIRHLGNVLDEAPERADRGDDIGGVGVVVFDAAADPGDSGGPVLDLDGNVVAITFGAVVSTTGGKRVIGQQQGTSVESINRVWDQLKDDIDTTFL